MKIPSLAALALFAFTVPAVAQNWAPIGTPGQDIYSLIVDPTDPDHLVVTTSANAQETFDAGATWSPVVGPHPGSVIFEQLRFTERGELMLFSNWSGPNLPTNGKRVLIRHGSTWQTFGPTFATSSFEVVAHVVRGEANPDLVAVDTYEPFDFGGGWLYLSDDGGATWTNTGPSGRAGAGLWVVETQTGPYVVRIADASNKANSNYFIGRSSGWSAIDQTLVSALDERLTFAFDPRHPESMWMTLLEWSATMPAPIQRSTDGGASFQPTGATTFARTFIPHPRRPDWLLRADSLQIETSTDGGATWSLLAPLPSGANFVRNLACSEDGRYLYMWYFNWPSIFRLDMNPFQGTPECSAELNASGERGRIRALGSMSIQTNAIDLVADRLPTGQFGFFLTSESPGFTPSPAGSFGNLCLGGSIGRYSELIQNSGVHGTFEGRIDLNAMPVGIVPVAASMGETWRFQAWFRDAQAGTQGSNFTDAIALTLTQ